MNDVRTWTVPGRVNLIGEHLDYNGGLSLPMAIDRTLTVKVRSRADRTVNVWSDGRRATFDLGVDARQVTQWWRYVAAAIAAAGDAGIELTGVDLVIESSLPAGAGLASSAAVTAGTLLAVLDASGVDLPRAQIAALAQRAETHGVGVPVGRMDPLAVLAGTAGKAILIDHADDPPSLDSVPLTWADDGLSLVVIDTRVHHQLAASEYAARRDECAAAAKALGLEHLSTAGVDSIFSLGDDELSIRRTRHVITESARVKAAVTALKIGAWTQFGSILNASHVSLRDDFEVSCPELDVAVQTALTAGALGARMTGGGFGGSAIALVPLDRIDGLRSRVEAAQIASGWPRPDVFAVRAVDGATLKQ